MTARETLPQFRQDAYKYAMMYLQDCGEHYETLTQAEQQEVVDIIKENSVKMTMLPPQNLKDSLIITGEPIQLLNKEIIASTGKEKSIVLIYGGDKGQAELFEENSIIDLQDISHNEFSLPESTHIPLGTQDNRKATIFLRNIEGVTFTLTIAASPAYRLLDPSGASSLIIDINSNEENPRPVSSIQLELLD
jgi:hypothetical protein